MGALLVFSLAALAAALLWGRSPARRLPQACRPEPAPGMSSGVASVPLLLELLGTALDSGLSIQGALQVVAGVAGNRLRKSLLQVVAGLNIGASWEDSWAGSLVDTDMVQIHDALSFGALTGASAAPLLYAQAQHYRTAASRSAQKRAAALGVKLVMPLGLCSLPAFIAVGVVPVVMAMIPSM
ncbi:pilus assembly protein TadC [Arthrobacter stackebrandtii]|uniref:Pilus assembly protein TadC n=1 Tax=Arthrobacter stackebrandtii TaxID=272161 RepID=A0ABS4YUF3_9MICC|nr:pilus assembly protein TadC [Arthrobacter stackebrandtii]